MAEKAVVTTGLAVDPKNNTYYAFIEVKEAGKYYFDAEGTRGIANELVKLAEDIEKKPPIEEGRAVDDRG